jgi:hypothetical protein
MIANDRHQQPASNQQNCNKQEISDSYPSQHR